MHEKSLWCLPIPAVEEYRKCLSRPRWSDGSVRSYQRSQGVRWHAGSGSFGEKLLRRDSFKKVLPLGMLHVMQSHL